MLPASRQCSACPAPLLPGRRVDARFCDTRCKERARWRRRRLLMDAGRAVTGAH
jgi:predicted nucleic acid-binding Zn ribbon protein